MPGNDVVTLNVEGFPASLRRRLKAAAALRSITLREALAEASRDWLAKVEHPTALHRPGAPPHVFTGEPECADPDCGCHQAHRGSVT